MSSVQRELPPSTTTSPGDSSSASSSTVAWVAAPAGTMTQTTRGPFSSETSAWRLSTSETSGLRS